MALNTKNSARRDRREDANLLGHFLHLHLLLSLLVTFFPTDQLSFKAGVALLASPGLTSVEERELCSSGPRAEIPGQGLDWPSVGHTPISRPITAIRGWDIKTGSPMLRKRKNRCLFREVCRKPKGLLWLCLDLLSRPLAPLDG